MNSAIAKGCALTTLALASLLTAQAALATPPQDEVKTVAVHYRDLDLSQPQDAKRLYWRIKSAARIACDNDPESDLIRLAEYKRCMREAVANAVAQVKSPQLTGIHQAAIQRFSGG